QKRAESELADPVGFYFHHSTPGLGAALQPYKSPEWEGRVEWGNRQRDKALSGMKYFDEVLRSQPYVAGEKFSMADITVLGGLIFAGFASIAIPDECTALVAWQGKIMGHRAVEQPVDRLTARLAQYRYRPAADLRWTCSNKVRLERLRRGRCRAARTFNS
nr:hypothetical protein [Tanacetum cinerariifolium]